MDTVDNVAQIRAHKNSYIKQINTLLSTDKHMKFHQSGVQQNEV